MGTDGPASRREIEDSTAARLAEIVAAAERAAKQVIDEAEAEARTRIADAERGGGADRRRAPRRAGRPDRGDQRPGGGAGAPGRGAAGGAGPAKAEMGGAEALGGSAAKGRREPSDAAEPSRAATPSLTVVGGARGAGSRQRPAPAAPPRERRRPRRGPRRVSARATPAAELRRRSRPLDGGSPAGARLLATQMAVSGSSRAEIEARLRNGFEIDRHAGDPRRDPRPGEVVRTKGLGSRRRTGSRYERGSTRLMNYGDEPPRRRRPPQQKPKGNLRLVVAIMGAVIFGLLIAPARLLWRR